VCCFGDRVRRKLAPVGHFIAPRSAIPGASTLAARREGRCSTAIRRGQGEEEAGSGSVWIWVTWVLRSAGAIPCTERTCPRNQVTPYATDLPANDRRGRDFVVADVHGCFATLETALVDYGARSAEALDWMQTRITATGPRVRPVRVDRASRERDCSGAKRDGQESRGSALSASMTETVVRRAIWSPQVSSRFNGLSRRSAHKPGAEQHRRFAWQKPVCDLAVGDGIGQGGALEQYGCRT